MITRYAFDDVYTYENSTVLKNKANHRTQEALEKFERLSNINRMVEDPPQGNFDYAHLMALHHHLFQDVYDWAGKERNVPISKGQTRFANPRFIESYAAGLLQRLVKENHLKGLSPEEFVERASHYVLELNLVHPFREGNGRAIRYFLTLLAQNAGYDVDIQALKAGWLDACIEGVTGSEQPMMDVIAGALVVFED
jgi:cell filamentation protein